MPTTKPTYFTVEREVERGFRCVRCAKEFALGERYERVQIGGWNSIPLKERVCLSCAADAAARGEESAGGGRRKSPA